MQRRHQRANLDSLSSSCLSVQNPLSLMTQTDLRTDRYIQSYHLYDLHKCNHHSYPTRDGYPQMYSQLACLSSALL